MMRTTAPRYVLSIVSALLLSAAFSGLLTGCAGKPEPVVPLPEPVVIPPPPAEEPQEPEPVPEMQYENRFVHNGVTYRVSSFGLPGDYELSVFVIRGEFIIHDIAIPIDWDVTDVFIADLNRNGFPELFVTGASYPADPDSGTAGLHSGTAGLHSGTAGVETGKRPFEGRLIGWEYGALELRELRLPRFTEPQASAYRGGDIFTFERDKIVRQYDTDEGPVTVEYVFSLRRRLEVL